MKVVVIGGAGYVGLITALGMAELGHDVVAVDVDEGRIAGLNEGRSSIHEDGLETMLSRLLERGRIRFTTSARADIAGSEVVVIAIGTPAQDDGRADLSQMKEVAESLQGAIVGYTVIVVKSTVPVGGIETMQDILSQALTEGTDFDIVSNPEFLREGHGLYDAAHPHRIIIGTASDRAREVMRRLYAPLLVAGDVPFVETGVTSAQMIKYASNAFLATRVSFINEIAELCERLGADIDEVRVGMGLDPRIGGDYLQAGLGFGGPCLEKDLRALLHVARMNENESPILASVLERNEMQAAMVMAKIEELIGSDLSQREIAVLGFSFKPGTDDTRGSRALQMVRELRARGAAIRAHDPVASLAGTMSEGVVSVDNALEAIDGADCVVVLTPWPEYRLLDWDLAATRMAAPNLVDPWNLLDRRLAEASGFAYRGFGKSGASELRPPR